MFDERNDKLECLGLELYIHMGFTAENNGR